MSQITPSRGLSIGQVSRATGVNIETIRYYERIGILPEPARTQGRHRLYEASHVGRLKFIKRSRTLGFSLEEIRGLLHLVDGAKFTCAEVNEITVAHLSDIRAKITDLRRMEKVLQQMTAQCALGKVPGCPIIDALGDTAPV